MKQKTAFFATRNLVFIALATAILCMIAPCSITLPFAPTIPYSLATFAMYLLIVIMDDKQSTLCILLYLVMGFIGLPVFSGFTGGAGKLLGPTGGYIIGYLFIGIIGGGFITHFRQKTYMYPAGMLFSTLILYTFGTAWFLLVMDETSLYAALTMCVIPFVLPDICKMLLAVFLGVKLRRRLTAAGVIF